MAAGLALFALVGHFAGRQSARAGLFHATRRAPADGTPVSSSVLPPREKPAAINRERLDVAMNRLKALIRGTPELSLDYEAQEELRRLLADLGPEELASLYASVDPSIDRVLAMKIGALWAAKDPDGALRAALNLGEGSPRRAIEVFSEWGRSQPEQALAWLASDRVPEELRKISGSLYEEILQGTDLLEKNFSLATGCISKMREKDAAIVLSNWAQTYAEDPGMRDQLVAFAKQTGRPMDYATLNASLVRAWPQDDPVTMMNYLIGLKDYLQASTEPPETQLTVDAAAVGTAMIREYDRSALEWWLDRHADSTEVPAPLSSALMSWAQHYPDKAAQWFAEQTPSAQVDAMRASLAVSLASTSEFEKSAAQTESIIGEQARQDAAERLNYIWSHRAPEAAAEWRASHRELFPDGGGK